MGIHAAVAAYEGAARGRIGACGVAHGDRPRLGSRNHGLSQRKSDEIQHQAAGTKNTRLAITGIREDRSWNLGTSRRTFHTYSIPFNADPACPNYGASSIISSCVKVGKPSLAGQVPCTFCREIVNPANPRTVNVREPHAGVANLSGVTAGVCRFSSCQRRYRKANWRSRLLCIHRSANCRCVAGAGFLNPMPENQGRWPVEEVAA